VERRLLAVSRQDPIPMLACYVETSDFGYALALLWGEFVARSVVNAQGAEGFAQACVWALEQCVALHGLHWQDVALRALPGWSGIAPRPLTPGRWTRSLQAITCSWSSRCSRTWVRSWGSRRAGTDPEPIRFGERFHQDASEARFSSCERTDHATGDHEERLEDVGARLQASAPGSIQCNGSMKRWFDEVLPMAERVSARSLAVGDHRADADVARRRPCGSGSDPDRAQDGVRRRRAGPAALGPHGRETGLEHPTLRSATAGLDGFLDFALAVMAIVKAAPADPRAWTVLGS
jgi:hypothetical protein